MSDMIQDLIFLSMMIAGVSAFVLLLMKKWGVVEWVQVHGNDFFYKMFACDFCLSWWTCLTLSAGVCYVLDVLYMFIVVAMCSTCLCRKLL